MKMYKLAYLLLLLACTSLSACEGGVNNNGGNGGSGSTTTPTFDLQTTALQKEKVMFLLTNADQLDAEEWTIDFGDGDTYTGAVSDTVTHAYTNTSPWATAKATPSPSLWAVTPNNAR